MKTWINLPKALERSLTVSVLRSAVVLKPKLLARAFVLSGGSHLLQHSLPDASGEMVSSGRNVTPLEDDVLIESDSDTESSYCGSD